MARMVGSSRVSMRKTIGLLLCGAVAAIPLAVVPASGQQPPIKIGIVQELTGPLSAAGTSMRDGSLFAFDEINAKGGILGRKVETSVYDTQSDPPTSVAVMRRALSEKPFAVIGPVFSSTTMANMHLAQEAGVPQIVGAAAAMITQKGNPNIFRITFTQTFSMAKLAKWMVEDHKAEKVAVIWVNNAFGKGGWDNFNREWKERGQSILVDVPTEAGQVDFTAELAKVRASGAKNLFLYTHEDENARVMTQIRKMGIQFDNIIGETTLCSEITLHLAPEALEGVKCHVSLTPDSPIPAMREAGRRYTASTGRLTDYNVLQGYIAAQLVKAGVDASGTFDQAKFRSCLHGLYLEAAKEPGLLLDAFVGDNGDMDRESFITEVKGGKNVVMKVLPMYRTGYPRKACK